MLTSVLTETGIDNGTSYLLYMIVTGISIGCWWRSGVPGLFSIFYYSFLNSFLFFSNIFMCFTVYFEPSLTAVGVLTLSVDVRGLVAVGESVVLKLQVLFVY